MKPCPVAARCLAQIQFQFHGLARINPAWHCNPFVRSSSYSSSLSPIICFTSEKKSSLCSSIVPKFSDANCELATKNRIEEGTLTTNLEPQPNGWRVEVGSPSAPSYVSEAKLSLSDQAFFLLAFIAFTASAAFVSLIIATVPTLYAMSRGAMSLSKLTKTAREELPSTMAAIRLSGMEISDLTLELSDLSREIVAGVGKSAQVVQAAEAGIQKVGSLARQQTVAMIQERANLPTISLQTVVAGAAEKTSRAVRQATKTFMNMISGEPWSENINENRIGRFEI